MSTLSPSVADKVAVGTEQILQSSHVSDGPGRIATAPIPSVFMDDRGSIHRLRIGQQRVNLLYSRMEYMRSGVRTSGWCCAGDEEVEDEDDDVSVGKLAERINTVCMICFCVVATIMSHITRSLSFFFVFSTCTMP